MTLLYPERIRRDAETALRFAEASPRWASTRSASLSLSITFTILAALTIVAAFIPHVEFVAISLAFLVAFIAYMRLRPDALPKDICEIIIPFSALNVIYFGVGSLYAVFRPDSIVAPSLMPFLLAAQALALVGYLCFLGGYAFFFRNAAPAKVCGLEPTHALGYVLPAMLGAAGQSVHRLQVDRMLGGLGISPAISFLQQFGILFHFGWFLAWYQLWSGRLRWSRAPFVLAPLSVGAFLILFSTFGGKTTALVILAIPALAYYEVRRRLPMRWLIAVALLGVFVIFPIYNTFRFQNDALDTSRRVEMAVDTARTWNSDQYLDASVFSFLKRVAILTSIAAIVSDTGRWVDYRYGETLILAPIGMFIPRFLWPQKPNISIGREFGAVFRLTSSMDMATEVAPSMVGDFYWNYSVPGVVVGMLLLGIGYRWYFQKFGVGRGYAPIGKGIYIALMPAALLIEGNVAIVVGGLIKSGLILAALVAVGRRIGWVQEIATEA